MKGCGCCWLFTVVIGLVISAVVLLDLGISLAGTFTFVSFLAIVLGLLSCIGCGVKKGRSKTLRRKYFKDNGGLLLKEELSNGGATASTTRIFTEKEVNKATKGYRRQENILGEGAFGTVYKGTLSSSGKQVVVVKKYNVNAAVGNPNQLVNAVIAGGGLSQKNMVRILGCCLETKMPLMVYEYVANATSLYEKIRNKKLPSWDLRLKIAAEIAEVLAHLHSATKEEVIHCNVKARNILVLNDETNTAKLSDLGASGWMGALELSTLVERTLGYLDPEFLRTKSFTKKSDVYSFGVVLVELITGKEAFSFDRPEPEMNLASWFVRSVEQSETGALPPIIVDREVTVHETVQKVADVAKRCLGLKGEGRPTMKQVATKLQVLRNNINAYVVDVRDDVGDGGI